MATEEAIAAVLRSIPDIVVHEELPAADATHGTLASPLPEPLQDYLDYRHIRLYSHQTRAIELIRAERNVILATPTASGKSLAFNLPVFERLCTDPFATALYLYPTKALANDQHRSVLELERFTGIQVVSAIYDGDTPGHRRPAIRDRSRLVISNPHELHQLLSWHAKWARFFSGLSFVVVDEAHRYRGVFGSHVAMLMRRLQRIAALYGADPVFILSTATLANSAGFAADLIGEACTAVTADGSPRGARHIVLVNPFSGGDTTTGSTHAAAAGILSACVGDGFQTLCFTVSRRMAETVAGWTNDRLERTGIRTGNRVSAYRAGYLPEERRTLEQALKNGALRGIVSTNALEVGIDVGGLDAVIIAGFPGTMISTWQQAGRAGRRLAPSLAFLVAFNDPIDQYYMRNPAGFLSSPCEEAFIDLANPYILAGHLLCAAAEAPLSRGEAAGYFGEDAPAAAESLALEGLFASSRAGWVYAGTGRAAGLVSLDAIAPDSFSVVCHGHLLETLNRAQAYREAHQGAVLLHRGTTYLVEDLDLATRRVRVREEEVDYWTESLKSVSTEVLNWDRHRDFGRMTVHYGAIRVTEQYTAYRIRKGDEVIGTRPLDLPPVSFETRALGIAVPGHAAEAVTTAGLDLAGGLHAAEHLLIAATPVHVLCDRWDLGGLSSGCMPGIDGPAILIYDGYEGGIGLAEKAYRLFPAIVATAASIVSGCTCDRGCPACIISPKCGSGNVPLDKEAARLLLSEMNGCSGCDFPVDAGLKAARPVISGRRSSS